MKRCVLFILLLCMLGASALVHAQSEDPMGAYAPVLARYVAGLSGDEAVLESDESVATCYQCSLIADEDPMQAIGYVFCDLDGDGSPELLIGEAVGQQLLGGCLFEILTLRDGAPVTVQRGWERYRVYLTFDPAAGRFGYYAEGSSGADNSVYEYGLAAPGMAAWGDAHVLEANADPDGDTVRWTLDGKKVSEKKANALIDSWLGLANQCTLMLTSFAAYVGG